MANTNEEKTPKNINDVNNRLCPLRFGLEEQTCLKERCEWYLNGYLHCAMFATPTILFAENRGLKLNFPSEMKESDNDG